jgi:uncharacterized repeat protein (TIGR03803 family)
LRPSRRFVGSIALFGITACGGASIPTAASNAAFASATGDAAAGHFRLLHSFGDAPDGINPSGALTPLGGFLYGLAQRGGTHGNGTIYRLSVTGREKVLYSMNSYDGYSPAGALLAYQGVLYGTIAVGQNSEGAVYSVTTRGKFDIIHRFSGLDGLDPAAGLMESSGLLYGTTYEGGAHGVGTVYSITTSGGENVIYSFRDYSGDATYPASTLVFWKNKLYGTSAGGGTNNEGTVFSVSAAGKEAVLHSFGNGSDGQDPMSASLSLLGGALYGTTSEGGTYGLGVVFKVMPTGAVRTIYNFGDNKGDGTYPAGGVIPYKDALYGTTSSGGNGNQGAIFRVTPRGKETVLYSFSGDDGIGSYSHVLAEGTNFYGTMFGGGQYGGTGFQGGTAYRFTP